MKSLGTWNGRRHPAVFPISVFSATSPRPLRLCGSFSRPGFTAETRRTQRWRRESQIGISLALIVSESRRPSLVIQFIFFANMIDVGRLKSTVGARGLLQ